MQHACAEGRRVLLLAPKSILDSSWRDYLRDRDVECSEVLDRGAFRSLYLRDPDGHIVEIAFHDREEFTLVGELR